MAIVLNSKDLFVTDGSIRAGSGTGYQQKFWINNKHTLVKLNSKLREDEKEYSAYILGRAFGLNTVKHTKSEYKFRGAMHKGCQSDIFFNRVLETSSGTYDKIEKTYPDVLRELNGQKSAKSKFIVYIKVLNKIINSTDEAHIANYILSILVFDFLICNEDRHYNNIEIIENVITGERRFAPIFDNGMSFLKTNASSIESWKYRDFKTGPFSTSPSKNLIDIQRAKGIARQFLVNAGGIQGISRLPIIDGHKQIVIHQFRELLGNI